LSGGIDLKGTPMRRGLFMTGAFIALSLATFAGAQESEEAVPPPDGKPLSEIIAKVEKRDAFRYIDEIRWNSDGFYEVIYFTTDKAKVEMNFNPVTGEPQ
jgi:hypothetical protein